MPKTEILLAEPGDTVAGIVISPIYRMCYLCLNGEDGVATKQDTRVTQVTIRGHTLICPGCDGTGKMRTPYSRYEVREGVVDTVELYITAEGRTGRYILAMDDTLYGFKLDRVFPTSAEAQLHLDTLPPPPVREASRNFIRDLFGED